jgi:hypothetical protein
VAADAQWDPGAKQRKGSLEQQLIEELSVLIYETATAFKIDALTTLIKISHIVKRNAPNNSKSRNHSMRRAPMILSRSIMTSLEDPNLILTIQNHSFSTRIVSSIGNVFQKECTRSRFNRLRHKIAETRSRLRNAYV